MPLTLPSNWGQYIGVGSPLDARDTTFTTPEGWDQSLAWVRQYDPNASIEGTTMPTGEGGQYLKFDQSKLPMNAMGGQGIEGILNLQGLQNTGPYRGPRTQDVNFGDVGSTRFMNTLGGNERGLADILGPLVVGGFAGLGAGGFNLLGNVISKLPNLQNMFSNAFNPQQQIPQEQLVLMRLMQQQQQQQGGGYG